MPSGRPAVSRLLRLMLVPGPAPRRRERAILRLGSAPPFAAPNSSASPSRVPDNGLLLTIGRSKTDQDGKRQRLAIWANPTEPGSCPAAALDAWLAHRRSAPGPRMDRERVCAPNARCSAPSPKTGRVTGEPLSDTAWSG